MMLGQLNSDNLNQKGDSTTNEILIAFIILIGIISLRSVNWLECHLMDTS